MVDVAVTILGGLPVIADVWFSGPDYQGEYDSGVNAIYWLKTKHGGKGNEVSQNVYDRLEKYDSYWQADVTERASDALAYEDDHDEESDSTMFQMSPAIISSPHP